MNRLSLVKRMLCGTLLAVCQTLVYGAESRIPIYGPSTISVPGHYFLTQNFSVTSGAAIRITASDVVLDLNGRTLTHTSTTGLNDRVIWLDSENPLKGVAITNGIISGGREAIGSSDSAGYAYPVQVHVEGVTISGSATGINIQSGELVDILDCRIEALNTGIAMTYASNFPSPRLVANVLNNVVHAPTNGISILGARSSMVRGNAVTGVNVGGIVLASVPGPSGGGNAVEDNLVSGAPGGTTSDGIVLRTTGFPGNVAPTNLVLRNIVTGMGRYGIWSYLDDTRLEGNLVSHCGSHGIFIGTSPSPGVDWGFRNHLEQNESTGNGGCGVMFQNGNPNSYRMNVSLGNGVPGYCGPPGVAPPPPAVAVGIGNM